MRGQEELGRTRTKMSCCCDVLLVEDDEDLRSAMVMVMEAHGFRVVVAEDGAAALRAIEQMGTPALTLLDLVADFSTEMMIELQARRVPVVLMSGRHNLEGQARRIGAVGTLPKPFGMDELERMLRRWCPPRPRALPVNDTLLPL